MEDEKRLISACLRGDRAAQRTLYVVHKDKLYTLCLRYAYNREEAEDMLQEGFIKIYRDLKNYKPIAPLYAWMRTVVVRTALEHIRKRKRRPQSQGTVDEFYDLGRDEESSSQMQAQELITLIRQLPTDLCYCFNLYAIDGYSHKEIAELLGITEGNSKMRVSRARAILKKQVEKLFEVN